jgi:DNA adenine methylase
MEHAPPHFLGNGATTMNITATIKRPALRYYGSQFDNAAWIISHWPQHNVRTIPFAGGLNEELQAPLVKLITASDLDGRVCNFFAMLRDWRDDLITAIKLTPWHEAEYQLSRVVSDDPLEDARRFFFTCWMSVQGGPYPGKSGFRMQKSVDTRWSIPPSDAINIDHLYAVAERLKWIQFLQRDGREIIDLFKNTEDGLIWCDPPFLKDTRAQSTGYTIDSTIQLHRDTAELLRQARGYALITGYGWNKDGTKNGLYEELYEAHGWTRVDKEARTNSGGKRIQSIWLSPRTVAALEQEQQERTHEQLPLLSSP